ncbi:peptidase C14 [Hyaloscypha bicolor E]|uniref:Peptidase C14 n=1 Tax=Hyaloscypha bicolor E TaxID=1095630 RepID=A0A2J6SWK5_9HELO|nr:peptidase C14 [Hyaloscypha bicolor E]PMD55154.1 peptidase C14 [Hyaloscypha bicolor E]
MPRRKALIIGINYFGSSHQLNGCVNDAKNIRNFLVQDRGFSPAPHDMVFLTDEAPNQGTPFFPTGANIMAALHWLATGNSPGDSVWLSYSGHGGQVKDPDGDRESGLDDTICPVDFESQGQIDSDTLHKVIVSPMIKGARLTVLFDCCHSGSAIELPYVYRPNSQGEVNLIDNVKQGVNLATGAMNLLRGGFSAAKIQDAKVLLGGAKSFFAGLQHRPVGDVNEDGLGEENFIEPWKHEGKDVWMFSGCADHQTSADTTIAGAATGAMSHVFLQTMRENPNQSYIQVLQNTRVSLAKKYQQIPQLSVGGLYDLDQQVNF